MGERPRMLVSACLLGVACRYDGRGQAIPRLNELLAACEVIPVCPEQLGGLPTPRTPSERVGEKVLARDGTDVTCAFARGAAEALRLARLTGARLALLKARSPSCGSGEVYDGSFTGRTVPGNGVAAQALVDAGIEVYNEGQFDPLLSKLKGNEL